MTLQELYDLLGGDFCDALERLGDAETVYAFVLRFPEDRSYEELLRYLSENNLKRSFYASHTLKGIAQTLGFGHLGKSACAVCEDLRCGTFPTEIHLQQMKVDFQFTIKAINEFKNSN